MWALDAAFWHFSLTSLVPLGPSPAGVADPLAQGRRPVLRCPPPPTHDTHLDSAPSALLPGKAAAGPRARAPLLPCARARSGLFPPVQLCRGAARGRSGVWWARSGGSCAFPPTQRRREQQRRRRRRRRLESRCRVSHPGSGRDPAAAAAEMWPVSTANMAEVRERAPPPRPGAGRPWALAGEEWSGPG